MNNNLQSYIEKVKKIMKKNIPQRDYYAYVRTYGCQQNVSDSEKFKGLLEEMGFVLVDDASKADLILFNTCAIREHAEDKVFGNVGALKHYKKRNPNLIIAVCGCMTEQEHIAKKLKSSYPFVDIVFGTKSMSEFPLLIYRKLHLNKRIFEKNPNDTPLSENVPIHRDGKFKAWLPIMYGCNNFCSYCIVPYVRGRERSRQFDNVVNEAKELISSGYKEITLLGQNVNSYGKDLENNANFPNLLKEISSIEGDYWIRFMTSHPKDASFEMIDTIAGNEHISKHLHLPVQSGSDRILKQMNRVYDRKRYLDIINYAKSKIKDVSLTSDIIVGFPGETYEDFKQTLSLIKEVEYSSLFTFIYSPRQGTPAAKMDDPISKEEKQEWFQELLETQEKIAAKRCNSMVGNTEKALIEGKTNDGQHLMARTSGNIIVEVNGNDNMIGTFQAVKITEALNWTLRGTIKDIN